MANEEQLMAWLHQRRSKSFRVSWLVLIAQLASHAIVALQTMKSLGKILRTAFGLNKSIESWQFY